MGGRLGRAAGLKLLVGGNDEVESDEGAEQVAQVAQKPLQVGAAEALRWTARNSRDELLK